MRFLLLDDEKVSRFMLRQLVHTIPGAIIYEAENAARARDRLAELTAPAVCIFDVRLPGESGLDLLWWLRGQPRYQAFPVLLFTGNDDEETRRRATSLRVEGYLPKPPDKDSAERVIGVATRLAEDILPDPISLAQRLDTSPSRLLNYVDALGKQLIELGKTSDESVWQNQVSRCSQVANALGSRYLLQILQRLQHAEADDRNDWLSAAALAVGGMRARLSGAS